MCIARAVGREGANDIVDVRTVQILLNVNRAGWAGTGAAQRVHPSR
jgi:hypothetical protein